MNEQDKVGQWNMDLNASRHFYVADVSFYLILSPVPVSQATYVHATINTWKQNSLTYFIWLHAYSIFSIVELKKGSHLDVFPPLNEFYYIRLQ